MAYNDISKNFTYENGGTIDGDLALTTMAANTKIKNTSSGQLYAKRSGFTNVFDKTNTYANYLKADEFGINTSGSGNGVASITYSTSGRKITQNLTNFTTPSDLATASDNLKSQAVGSISVSGRTVTYKNVNGQPLGSFQTQDNNTTYSAGNGLSLSGTTFSVSQELLDKINSFTGVPTGIISMWSGVVGNIPAGWHLCDGTSGTPDLRDKFVIGAGASYSPGAQGEFNTVGSGTRFWSNDDLSYNGGGGVDLRSIENPTSGTLTYVGTMTGTVRSMRLNFPVPFSSIPIPVMNAVIGHDGDGVAIARPNVLVDACETGHIIFTNPNNDGIWRVWFNITGTTEPSQLVSNADRDYNYYALCYIMKT